MLLLSGSAAAFTLDDRSATKPDGTPRFTDPDEVLPTGQWQIAPAGTYSPEQGFAPRLPVPGEAVPGASPFFASSPLRQ